MSVQHRPMWLGLSLLLGLSAVLRWHGVDDTVLWFDEAYSFWFASQPLGDLWTTIPNMEPHPPLYYTMLKAWMIFGDSEAALRSLSVLFGVATVPVVFLFGRIIGGPWVGLNAALIFALSPLNIAFAQQARPYAVLTFFAATAMCGTAWLVSHPHKATVPLFSGTTFGARHRAWAALIVGTAMSLWLHNLSIFLPMTLSVIGAIFYFYGVPKRRVFAANGILAGLFVLGLWGPFLPWLWTQTQNVSGAFWIAPLTVQDFSTTVMYLFAPIITSFEATAPLFFAVFISLAAFGYRFLKRQRQPMTAYMLAAFVILPLVFEVLVSVTFRPLLLAKSLMWTALPFYVLIAVGALDLQKLWMRWAAVSLICLAFLSSDPKAYFGHGDEGWGVIADLIARQATSDDAVFFVPNSVEIPFVYYFPKTLKSAPQLIPLPAPFPAVGLDNPYPAGQMGEPALTAQDVTKALTTAKAFSTIWLITRRVEFDPGDHLVMGLSRQRSSIKTWAFLGVTVYRFR